MSQAFVKEEDEQWLHEVAPTIQALVNYLTRQNNGIRYMKSEVVFNREPPRHYII